MFFIYGRRPEVAESDTLQSLDLRLREIKKVSSTTALLFIFPRLPRLFFGLGNLVFVMQMRLLNGGGPVRID